MAVTAATAEFYPHVGVVRIDQPETRNALTEDVRDALVAACRAFDADPAVHCILLAGTDGYFASGTDTETPSGFWTAIAAFETPLVAAVSGYALGAGWELALMCDLVVAAENCDFGMPEVTVGLAPSGGAAKRITEIVGKHRAMELVLTGRRISGQEAFRLGLVNLASRKKEWFDQAMLIADRIAKRPPGAVRLAKRAVLDR
jgi:enoyl-CoA hydratase/carnithine racemase